MDIARPDLKRRRKRNRTLFTIAGLGLIALVTMRLAKLEPAVPKVESAQVWSGVVERGEMIRQVRGNGSLVPEKIVTVQSDTGGTVEDILVLPGAEVEPDTVLLVLGNPQLKQETFDQKWQVKAAESRYLHNTDLHVEGATICMVTHDPRFAGHADRQIHLFDGRIVEENTNEPVLKHE